MIVSTTRLLTIMVRTQSWSTSFQSNPSRTIHSLNYLHCNSHNIIRHLLKYYCSHYQPYLTMFPQSLATPYHVPCGLATPYHVLGGLCHTLPCPLGWSNHTLPCSSWCSSNVQLRSDCLFSASSMSSATTPAPVTGH